MGVGPQEQSLLVRAATWYYRNFNLQRGRGIISRLLGSFLSVRVDEDLKVRLVNPMEYNQKTLLFGDGFYDCESNELRYFESILQPGMVVIDAGSNLGVYTLLASKRVAPDGMVHAFEPSPDQYKHCQLNIRINGLSNVILNKIALSDCSGSRNLFLAQGGNKGINSLGTANGSSTCCTVECITLDQYIEKNDIKRIDVIKVDVEGAESLLLRGAQRTIESLRPKMILIELNEEYSRSLGYGTIDAKIFLKNHGYSLFKLNGLDNTVSVTLEEEWANILALHSSADMHYYEALSSLVRVSDRV